MRREYMHILYVQDNDEGVPSSVPQSPLPGSHKYKRPGYNNPDYGEVLLKFGAPADKLEGTTGGKVTHSQLKIVSHRLNVVAIPACTDVEHRHTE
jgi:hypothetical protein